MGTNVDPINDSNLISVDFRDYVETLGDSATDPSPTHPLSRSLEPNIGQLTTSGEESVSTGNLSDTKTYN